VSEQLRHQTTLGATTHPRSSQGHLAEGKILASHPSVTSQAIETLDTAVHFGRHRGFTTAIAVRLKAAPALENRDPVQKRLSPRRLQPCREPPTAAPFTGSVTNLMAPAEARKARTTTGRRNTVSSRCRAAAIPSAEWSSAE
jgi:hypothetical protein